MILKSKEIAKILNISPSTVSLAINNKPGVSDETRRKVFAVFEEFYSSEKFALMDSSIKGKETVLSQSGNKGSIILIVHKTQKQLFTPNPFFQGVIEGCQAEAMKQGYILKITYFNSEMNKNLFFDSLKEEDVAGVVVYALELDNEGVKMYREMTKPLVMLDARYPYESMDMVTIANRSSIENAFKYAYDMGHRKIGYLRSHTMIRNFEDRYTGYLNGLRLAGLEFNEKYVFNIHSTLKEAQKDFLEVLNTPLNELPTIFLTDVDYIVAGALRAIKKKGYSVPDDISLIGFDDYEMVSELDPPLTTIRINDCFGSTAVGRLIEKIENNDSLFLNIEVATELKIRGSVKQIEV